MHHYFSPCLQYIFADVLHDCIWTTTDMAVTLTRHDLDFRPSMMYIHPKLSSVVAAHDQNTNSVRCAKNSQQSFDFATFNYFAALYFTGFRVFVEADGRIGRRFCLVRIVAG